MSVDQQDNQTVTAEPASEAAWQTIQRVILPGERGLE